MRIPLACAVGLWLFTEVAAAQTFRGGIQGIVIDQAGAMVPGATITVTSTGTGLSRAIQTDPNGNYFFSELPVGQYDVEASLQGFSTQTQRRVDVGASASVRVDFELRPGGVVLPSWVIDAVSLAPRGAHPSYAHGYYDRDNAFYRSWDEISRDRDRFTAWIERHVLGTKDVDEYHRSLRETPVEA